MNSWAGNKTDSLKAVMIGKGPVKEKLKAYNQIALILIDAGKQDSARIYLDTAIRLGKKNNFKKGLPVFYINQGNSYMMQSNYTSALESYLNCITLREELKDSAGLMNAYNSIGIVYFRMNSTDKAYEYWTKSLELCDRLRKESMKIDVYANLSMVMDAKGKRSVSIDYMLKSIQLAQKYKDSVKVAMVSANLGQELVVLKRYKEALTYLRMSEAYGADQENGGVGSSSTYIGLGTVYKELKQYKLAHSYYDKAFVVSRKLKSAGELKEEYLAMSELSAAENKMEDAYRYHQLYHQYNDSIFNKQNMDKFSDLKAGYEISRKDQQMKAREREKALIQESKDRRQKLYDYALLAGLLVVVILAGMMYRSYRIQKRSNALILDHKQRIERTNTELAQVNKEISDSIHYAKRIQEALLPDRETILEFLTRAFVFYQPKNVVSGDFYFFARVSEDECVLAACDCTGHGVPGAFMSMIGTEQLEKIILERKITTPGLILDELHKGVRKALQQDQNQTRDGMDVALCKLNVKTRKIEFAGANRPLWIMNNGIDLMELKADKQAVGGLESSLHKPFTNKEWTLLPGNRVYLFSDGYADQFGGEKGKKFMVRNFQSLLRSFSEMGLPEQEDALRKQFDVWKGRTEQVDDILVIGFEV